MHRNFYIFGPSDYIKNSLHDILQFKYVGYSDFSENKTFKKYLLKILISPKVSDYIKRFIFSISPTLFKSYSIEVSDCNKLYIIFYERNPLAHNEIFLKHLKKRYPSAKFIYMFTNLISDSWLNSFSANFDFIKKNSIYDLVITFNPVDAQKYGFRYHDFVNSRITFNQNNIEESDVFFCGRDKGRSSSIVELYDYLTLKGKKCDFIIISDSKTQKIIRDGITYYDNMLPNEIVLRHMSKAKCILDISFDKEQPGLSLRFSEAIAYSKKLLTDNKYAEIHPLSKPHQVSVFNNVEDINLDFLEYQPAISDFISPELVSPVNLLEFIAKELE